jgi:hypothetical protein
MIKVQEYMEKTGESDVNIQEKSQDVNVGLDVGSLSG